MDDMMVLQLIMELQRMNLEEYAVFGYRLTAKHAWQEMRHLVMMQLCRQGFNTPQGIIVCHGYVHICIAYMLSQSEASIMAYAVA